MRTMKIIAEIITFNPDIKILKENIDSIYPQVDSLLIVDNDSRNFLEIKKLLSRYCNIKLIKNPHNLGIAQALNQGLNFAKENNFSWIFTLDQDSLCGNFLIQEYKNYIENYMTNKTIILTPQILDLNSKKNVLQNENESKYENVNFAITSGSLINITNAFKIGCFDQKLFIDYVDYDFCINAINHKYEIVKVNKAILYHRLGEIKEYNMQIFKVEVTNHSPLRRYFLFRNKIILYKKYLWTNSYWVTKNILSSLKVFIKIMIFEKQKKDQFINILKGLNDGFKYKEKL